MNLLKQLRQMTFAPLKDCKDALVDSDGNLDSAVEFLKKKWSLKAGKKTDRVTSEWSVKLIQKKWWFAGVKLLCETDFVAKNETFQELLDSLLEDVLVAKTKITSLDNMPKQLLDNMITKVSEFVGKIWENVKLSDVVSWDELSYVYNHPGNNVASLVYYTGEDTGSAKEVALQVAAMNPTYCSVDDVDKEYYNELVNKFTSEMENSWKPADIIDMIVKGKVSKELSGIVLLEQPFIRDGAKKVKDILSDGFDVVGYLRMSI